MMCKYEQYFYKKCLDEIRTSYLSDEELIPAVAGAEMATAIGISSEEFFDNVKGCIMKELSLEDHKVRHKKLHGYLDELVADFIIHVGKLPSEVTVLELMEWSNKQITQPSVAKEEG